MKRRADVIQLPLPGEARPIRRRHPATNFILLAIAGLAIGISACLMAATT